MTLLTTGTAVLSTVTGLFSGNPKDPARFTEAESWYYAMIRGDQLAACRLKYMTGRFGCAPGGCDGDPRCGYATDAAKDYAFQLYQQGLKVLAGQLPLAQPLPVRGVPQTALGNTLADISDLTGAAAAGMGSPTRTQLAAADALGDAVNAGRLIFYGLVVFLVVFLLFRLAARR